MSTKRANSRPLAKIDTAPPPKDASHVDKYNKITATRSSPRRASILPSPKSSEIDGSSPEKAVPALIIDTKDQSTVISPADELDANIKHHKQRSARISQDWPTDVQSPAIGTRRSLVVVRPSVVPEMLRKRKPESIESDLKITPTASPIASIPITFVAHSLAVVARQTVLSTIIEELKPILKPVSVSKRTKRQKVVQVVDPNWKCIQCGTEAKNTPLQRKGPDGQRVIAYMNKELLQCLLC